MCFRADVDPFAHRTRRLHTSLAFGWCFFPSQYPPPPQSASAPLWCWPFPFGNQDGSHTDHRARRLPRLIAYPTTIDGISRTAWRRARAPSNRPGNRTSPAITTTSCPPVTRIRRFIRRPILCAHSIATETSPAPQRPCRPISERKFPHPNGFLVRTSSRIFVAFQVIWGLPSGNGESDDPATTCTPYRQQFTDQVMCNIELKCLLLLVVNHLLMVSRCCCWYSFPVCFFFYCPRLMCPLALIRIISRLLFS